MIHQSGLAEDAAPETEIDVGRIAIVASEAEPAQAAQARLVARFGQTPLERASAIVALGGDGFMLQTLHQNFERGLPVYGMNRGSVGFMMNAFAEEGLPQRLSAAQRAVITPLRMVARCIDGRVEEALAINEVSLLRETRQAAKLRISIDGRERMAELIADGLLVATPAGSTAYNLSANGPILPLEAALLALTPLSPFRPRRWRGALLPKQAHVRVEVLEARKRPVSAVADFQEIRDVREVEVRSDGARALTLLFDPGHSLEERLIREQFLV